MEISRRDLSRFKPGPRARIMLTAPKHFGIRLALLLVLQAFWLETSHSELPAGRNLEEEISKQESIFQSQGRNVPRGYTLDRSLLVYTQGLSSGFSAALANLVPADRWLDIGAGMGQAILDYHSAEYDRSHPEGRKRRGRKAQAVAMSIEDRRTPQWRQKAESLGPDRIRYLVGRRLREYSPEELGKFRVITDVAGGFSYTTNLSVFMESVLGVLEVQGSFYTMLQDVQSEAGTKRPHYEGSPFLTEIENAAGSAVNVCSWLKSIGCVQVSCESKSDWQPPVEAFHIHKVCSEIAVPPLTPVHYVAGTPPERRFQLKD